MSIRVSGVTKSFGGFRALDDVSLEVPEGRLVALLGPSGSGKTSLLRIIAGLERPDCGEVWLEGEEVTGRNVRDRHVGFVFQHYALFRHMTVFENVAFGLRVKGRQSRPSQRDIAAKVAELLQLVQLDWLADRFPSQLSGGQRQRVALARALAVEPRVLLLDEPFGALDARVRLELRRWLRRLHDEIKLTSVFVTHDQDEALELADRVVVMNQGRVEQEGTPDDVFDSPATPFVMRFLGSVNIFHGRVQDGRAVLGPLAVDYPDHPHSQPRNATGYARPHELELSRTQQGDAGLWATLQTLNSAGPVARLELTDGDGRAIRVELPHTQYEALQPLPGERLYVTARRVRVFLDAREEMAGSGI